MDDFENPPRRIPDIRETAPQYENLIVDARLGHGGDEVEQPPLGEDSFESVNGREQEPESDFSLVRERIYQCCYSYSVLLQHTVFQVLKELYRYSLHYKEGRGFKFIYKKVFKYRLTQR